MQFFNTPIQEKTESRMETRPKGPSVFASPGGKYKVDKQSLSKEFQDGASKYWRYQIDTRGYTGSFVQRFRNLQANSKPVKILVKV